MNNAKQIAENVLNEENAPPGFQILARAYLELLSDNEATEKIYRMNRQYVDDAKIKIEKLKKSRDVLRKAVEFYGDINNWKDVSSINESSFKYFYCLRQRTKDFEALNEKYHFYAGKKAREAMQADNEIFADDIK